MIIGEDGLPVFQNQFLKIKFNKLAKGLLDSIGQEMDEGTFDELKKRN